MRLLCLNNQQHRHRTHGRSPNLRRLHYSREPRYGAAVCKVTLRPSHKQAMVQASRGGNQVSLRRQGNRHNPCLPTIPGDNRPRSRHRLGHNRPSSRHPLPHRRQAATLLCHPGSNKYRARDRDLAHQRQGRAALVILELEHCSAAVTTIGRCYVQVAPRAHLASCASKRSKSLGGFTRYAKKNSAFVAAVKATSSLKTWLSRVSMLRSSVWARSE